MPPQGPKRSAWLERRPADLEADDVLRWWPRTEAGALKHERRAPEEASLVRVGAPADRGRQAPTSASSSFGRKLIAAINPVTGRLHGDLMPCAPEVAVARPARSPNLLGLPPAARRAVVAPAGRMLVVADLRQIELRVAAELSGDPTMRQAFAEGRDLHVLTASAITGAAEADVTTAQRKAAKPVNFGILYGQGARGLRATAWSDYGHRHHARRGRARPGGAARPLPRCCCTGSAG